MSTIDRETWHQRSLEGVGSYNLAIVAAVMAEHDKQWEQARVIDLDDYLRPCEQVELAQDAESCGHDPSKAVRMAVQRYREAPETDPFKQTSDIFGFVKQDLVIVFPEY